MTLKSEEKLTAQEYAKKFKKDEIVKWFERGCQEEEEEDEDDVEEIPGETPAERRKRIKVLKAGGDRFANLGAKKGDEKEGKDDGDSDEDPGPGPAPVWDEIKACRAENPPRADLSCVRVQKETAVDPSLWYCKHVNNLKLRMPPGVLTQLPPELAYLRNLTTLIVSHNSLNQLPDEMAKLPQLKNLEFTDNKVEQLPAAMEV